MLNPSGDTPLNRLLGMSSEEASVVFATQYDEAIHSLRYALSMMDGLDEAANEAMLNKAADILNNVVKVPKDLTVEESQPYVELSDLVYLGLLANELWQGREGFVERMEDML